MTLSTFCLHGFGVGPSLYRYDTAPQNPPKIFGGEIFRGFWGGESYGYTVVLVLLLFF